MQSLQNRSRIILRSRFIPSFVFSSIPLPIYFAGLFSSLYGRYIKPVSLMMPISIVQRFNSNLASIVEPNISCTTFNVLAPIYKRIDHLNQSIRESNFRELWFARNQMILDWLLHERSSVICLQEVWFGNEELVKMYHDRLGSAGYSIFQLARTNGRGDGLLTVIDKDYFKVINYRELLFNDFGDRVAQLLHVKSVIPFPLNEKQDIQQEVIIVNTHLLFPHDSSLSIVRLHQVYKILEYLEAYKNENKLTHIPIILCGDWNGSKSGHVYKFLRSQGFISSYDDAHHYTDSDAHRWVSHKNHRGNICGVDFIWLCNPNNSRKPLSTSWVEAIFSIIKAKLKSIPDELSFEETKELWIRADLDRNGVFDYEELEKIWKMMMMMKNESGNNKESEKEEEEAIGLKVNKAVLFPEETEKGMWPENYNLSDHACLTVQFSPVKMLRH